jgi:hypothetical protein
MDDSNRRFHRRLQWCLWGDEPLPPLANGNRTAEEHVLSGRFPFSLHFVKMTIDEKGSALNSRRRNQKIEEYHMHVFMGIFSCYTCSALFSECWPRGKEILPLSRFVD